MRTKDFTHKQYRYAQFLLNNDTSRRQAMRDAGYSDYMSNYPKQVEQSEGFNNAMALVAGETGMFYLKMLKELNNKDLEKEDFKTLLQGIDTVSKAWERFIPKTKELNNSLASVFDVVNEQALSNEPTIATQNDNNKNDEIVA